MICSVIEEFLLLALNSGETGEISGIIKGGLIVFDNTKKFESAEDKRLVGNCCESTDEEVEDFLMSKIFEFAILIVCM